LLEYHARYDDSASGQFIALDSSVVGAEPLTAAPHYATVRSVGTGRQQPGAPRTT
jgi:hypothetical protein